MKGVKTKKLLYNWQVTIHYEKKVTKFAST